jgi:glucose-1-phosphate thymidylyltransferase
MWRAGHHRVTALEHVANRPIADHVVEALASAGVSDVVVASSSAHADDVRRCLSESPIPLRHVAGRGPVDLAAGLRLAAPLVGDSPCITHLASGLLSEPLPTFLDALGSEVPDVGLIVHQQAGGDEHLSAAAKDMLHLAELDPRRAALGMTGVWLFGPGALRMVMGAPRSDHGRLDLTSIADSIASAGGSFQVRLVDSWCRYSGDPSDLLELNRITLDRLEGDQARRVPDGNRIEGRVRIHPTAAVSESVIVGPVVIGAEAQISDAYVGPYTAIGAGARIEGAEIERSIICAGASVMHVGGRLAASVLGRNARVYRDFSLPRAMRLQIGDGAEVALC